MCIIAIKPKGMPLMDDSTINIMYINNPDGAGYMYYDKSTKKVVVKKGFMTCKALLASLHSRDLTNVNVVLHFRIGTSGLNDKLNCHPYPVFNKNATKCSVDLAVAHNGILTAYNPPKGSKINDTQMFINEVLNNLNSNFIYDNDTLTLLRALIGSRNKLAFLDKKGNVVTIGDFVTSKEGYIYSNRSYEYESLLKPSTKATVKSAKKTLAKSTAKPTVKANKNTAVCPKKTCWDYATAYYNDPYRYLDYPYDDNFWKDDHDNEFWADWDTRHPSKA